MSLAGKHMFGSIGETRVTFVEKGVNADRKDFLKELLEYNGFEVLVEEDKRKTEEDFLSFLTENKFYINSSP